MRRWGLLVLLAIGCGGEQTSAPGPPETTAGMERVVKAPPALPVEGMTGPNGTAFSVTKRVGQITQYPCGSCHQQALPEPTRDRVSQRWSHLDITLVHGTSAGMDCKTCHDYANFQQLHRQDGSPVDFDQSYRVCQQCHFEQARDWAGGAHGKRVVGWQGKRVVRHCADCHDPHAPLFDKRMPLRSPSIPRTGSGRH